jgi:hypothetical protein
MRLLLALVAGCYAPSPASGVECSSTNECPGGQRCDLATRICDGVAPPIDAADLPADAPPVASGPWGKPVALAELNSQLTDGDPSMTADGLEIVFSSSRGSLFTSDIYRATRRSTAEPFDAPEEIGGLSGVNQDEFGPDISPDGLELHFGRVSNGRSDIFRTTRLDRDAPFDPPMLVDELSDPVRSDRNPAIAPNRLFALVDVELNGGNRDLRYFTRPSVDAPWDAAPNPTELATNDVDAGASFDGTNNTIYFHSDRNGSTELFTATRPAASAPFGEPVVIEELGAGNDPFVSADGRVIVYARGNDLFIATR